jgi:hypothetical protein
MSKQQTPVNPGFVVINKTRTFIWENTLKDHQRPYVLYDPRSRPRLKKTSSPVATSNYDREELSTTPRGKFRFVPGWMKPSLDSNYCKLIYEHLQQFDHVYLVGGGIGRLSGINNFINYLELSHPHFVEHITPNRYFRFTDFPERKLKEIFEKMVEEEQ